MIKTFDFLNQAWRDDAVMEEILHHMDGNKYSEMKTDLLLLRFDGFAQNVSIHSLNDNNAFSARIIPKRVTYRAMRQMLNQDFDHFCTEDITDILDGE